MHQVVARSTAAEPLLKVSNLSRHFPVGAHRVVKAVEQVSFEIAAGETLCIVGESGSGKSTLGRLVVGLDVPTGGAVTFAGHDCQPKRGRSGGRGPIQLIFQDPYASLNARHRVSDALAEVVRIHRPAIGEAAVSARVDELLVQVGLSPRDGMKYPHQFSGGQRQRICIARALAADPRFIVCDEPTSALDVSVQAQILNLIKLLQREQQLTYLFISHNLAVVYHIADAVGVMYLGRLVEMGRKHAVFGQPTHPYTRMLLNAVPKLERSPDAALAANGEIASAIAPPPGCAFHPRCPLADARCAREIPQMLAQPNGTFAACHAAEERRLPF
ncbi:ATP-binding cassette domain-containing protein [Xanthobacter dioxanivorans]|uniref:ATP-binding cassette domain-containing protein n=1 Tax=Xanthobacter dioxanivorans TaxID=2528964 RepID=A0A974PUE9_9HYPH|nr:oligopeptide/dipeptide ABC transporter ATP-binding protein [Xanthobacter dioxanivorans]QRG09636.1 ATP-binding cassette domain-containing protein [Xanthobacter dioxanivorans]